MLKTHRGHGRDDFMERMGFEWLVGSVLVVFLFIMKVRHGFYYFDLKRFDR